MDEVMKPNDASKYESTSSSEEFLSKKAIAGSSYPHPPSENGGVLLDEETADKVDSESTSFDDPKKETATELKSVVVDSPVVPVVASPLHAGLSKLFGDDYNINEAKFILFACCLIALNSGFVNATCLSGFLIEGEGSPGNPKDHMVAGFAGSYTNTSIGLADTNGVKYLYNLWILLSYMFGSFISAMICPHAKPFVIEPNYGPTFWIGGTMLLAASLLAMNGYPSRYIFFLVVCSNGIQNGIASIYSANLIRCTLSGATTDIAIVIAQMINGNYKGSAKGSVLGLICFFFWFGGIIGWFGARYFTVYTLFINAIIFYMCGLVLVVYVMKEFDVSFYGAVTGTWKWKQVLKKLNTDDGDLTKEKLMKIFDDIDADGDGSGDLDCEELIFGLKKAKVVMRSYEMNALFRAADENGDGSVTRDEWQALADKIL